MTGYGHDSKLPYDEGGTDFLVGGLGNDAISGHGELYGNEGDDALFASGTNNKCYGGDGNDWVLGGKGVDLIYGDDGNDKLQGLNGSDVIHGGAGNDVIFGYSEAWGGR